MCTPSTYGSSAELSCTGTSSCPSPNWTYLAGGNKRNTNGNDDETQRTDGWMNAEQSTSVGRAGACMRWSVHRSTTQKTKQYAVCGRITAGTANKTDSSRKSRLTLQRHKKQQQQQQTVQRAHHLLRKKKPNPATQPPSQQPTNQPTNALVAHLSVQPRDDLRLTGVNVTLHHTAETQRGANLPRRNECGHTTTQSPPKTPPQYNVHQRE